MTSRWILPLIVGLELAGAAGVIGWKSSQPTPPEADLARLDQETAADLRALRERTGTAPDGWRELGEAYLAYGYFPEAEACYQHAAELKDGSFEIEYGWAYTLQRLGRLDEAIDHFQTAATLAPPELAPTCWYHVGRCQLRREKPGAAAEAFGRTGEFPPAQFHLARIMLRNGRPEEALAILNRLIQQTPDQVQPLLLRTSIRKALGDEQAALADRELSDRATGTLKLSDHHEFLGPIRFRYGLLRKIQNVARLQAEGHVAEAAFHLHEVRPLADLSNRCKLTPRLAELELQRGQPEEAIRLLENLFESANATPEALMLLGDALAQQGRREEAVTTWERALRMRPGSALHVRLAEHFKQQMQEDQVRHHVARALCYEGIDAFRRNDLEAARQTLQEATKRDPEHDQSWFYLAESCRALGLSARAKDAYQRCLTRNPAHGRAEAGMAHLSNRR